MTDTVNTLTSDSTRGDEVKKADIPSVFGCLLAATISSILLECAFYIEALRHPDFGLIILGFPIFLTVNCLVTVVPFLLLQRFFKQGLLIEDVIICASICYTITILFEVCMTWLGDGQDMYIHRERRPYETLLMLSLQESWRLHLTRWFLSTCTWVLFDLRPLPKLKMRYVLPVSISVAVLFIYALSPSIVEYRAAAIAGDRPYCIMVASEEAWEYDDVERRSQLAYAHMQAETIQDGGSRGPYYTTNHAQLVLDNPREYLNWSYHAENFVPEASVKYVSGYKNGELIRKVATRTCEPKPHFIDTLNW